MGSVMAALCFSKSNTNTLSSSFRTLPRLTCSLSYSPLKFNISFATPKPKPKPKPETESPSQFLDDDDAGQLLIPWIVRGEDGNLKLQSEPPPSFLKAIANAQTGTKKRDRNQTTNTKKKSEMENKVHAVGGREEKRNDMVQNTHLNIWWYF